MENPLVTVNILSFNRIEELRLTLTKVYEQDYKNIEVIVVDNASSDGTLEMVKQEFPNVILIELNENIGIAGWNKGFEIAKGEYVLVLDDDAYPAKEAINLAVNEFKMNKLIGAITFRVINNFCDTGITKIFEGWIPETEYKIDNYSLILGCAFIIKKKIYIDDLFSRKYFVSAHEFPIILKLIIDQYQILYSPQITAFHFNQIENREISKIRMFYHVKNISNFIFYHFPKPCNFYYFSRFSFVFLLKSIKNFWFDYYLQAISKIIYRQIKFTKKRLSIDQARNILNTGVIEYKLNLFNKIFR